MKLIAVILIIAGYLSAPLSVDTLEEQEKVVFSSWGVILGLAIIAETAEPDTVFVDKPVVVDK